MMDFIVTTTIKTTQQLVEQAQRIAKEFNVLYIPRQKTTVATLCRQYGHVFIVYKQELRYVNQTGDSLFFHPSTSILRNRQTDPLLTLIGEQNQLVLDATLGMGSDSILMSIAGHRVVSVEMNPVIHYIVSNGLLTYDAGDTYINKAMRRIKTVCQNNLVYLKNSLDNQFDIVYFDPMFSHEITESKNLAGIRSLAKKEPLTIEHIKEAKRVARKKVIIKGHYKDDRLEKLGFIRIVRKNTKFHYGYIDVTSK